MGDNHRGLTEWEREIQEQRKQAGTHHDVGCGHGQEDQQIGGLPALESITNKRNRDHGSQRGRNEGRDKCDADTDHEGIAHRLDAANIGPSIETELIPLGVVVAPGLVETQDPYHRNGDEKVDENENRHNCEQVLSDESHQTNSSVPARRM